ncbi:ribokinase [Corynebacterium aquatimens]
MHLVGAVGADAHAEEATKLLRATGVDLSGVTTVSAPTGLALITVADDGENTILVVAGANSFVDKHLVEAHAATIADADLLLLQGEIPADGFRAAVELARAHATRVVVNLAPVIDVDQGALLQADPLVVNEHEAALVLRMLGHADSHDAATALVAAGFSSVVVTLGAHGAVVATSDAPPVDVPSPTVTAVDTVGAGDAFTGALCHRLVTGDGLADAVRFAVRVGAYAVTTPGAQPSYPTAADTLPG